MDLVESKSGAILDVSRQFVGEHLILWTLLVALLYCTVSYGTTKWNCVEDVVVY